MEKDYLSVSQALERLLRDVKPISVEEVSLSNAFGRVLAENISATHPLPPFSNSAMDGFAVFAEDVKDAAEVSPVTLKVVGDISAGESEILGLTSGQAIRIMTGAVLPPGANAVVPVESTSDPAALSERELPDHVVILKKVVEGDYIRPAGQDVLEGAEVLSIGRWLRAQDIGMLAALGFHVVQVYKKPRIALLSTGDELIEVNQRLTPGKIRDSNGYALEAAVNSTGAIPLRMGIIPDDAEKLADGFDRCVSSNADLIVSSAGVSMGAFDFVRTVIEKRGQLEFWKVNIRPGKPILMGSYREIPVIGLPGNPVSAIVTFEIFVKPFIHRLSGAKSTERIKIRAKLLHSITSDGRESYLRAKLSQNTLEYEVELVGSQDSGVLSSLIRANALIRLPAGVKAVKEGELVEVWDLQNLGFL